MRTIRVGVVGPGPDPAICVGQLFTLRDTAIVVTPIGQPQKQPHTRHQGSKEKQRRLRNKGGAGEDKN